MKKLAILCCLLIASFQARADIVCVSTLETGGKTQDTTIKVRGAKSRIDVGDNISSITDLTTGDTVILYHSAKKFRKIPSDVMLSKWKAELQGSGPAPTAPPKIVDTGRSEKIGDSTAEIYTTETPAAKFTFWITKDYPDFTAVNAELKRFQALEASLYKGLNLYPDFSKIDGVKIKYVVAFNNGKTSTFTLLSSKAQALDDAVFQVPADYTELSAPAAPSATPAPAAATSNP